MRNKFDDRLFNNRREGNNSGAAYYEDTHDAKGNYIGGGSFADYTPSSAKPNQTNYASSPEAQPKYAESQSKQYYSPPKQMPQQPVVKPLNFNPSRGYGNVVVYEPRTPSDVQSLIDYLKRKEPAIINLDSVDENDAQRILDFFSGAVYALNGSIHRISGNIFLLTPEGVAITAPM